MSNILILGSEGFIGQHLVDHFASKGYKVTGCDLFERGSSTKYQYQKVSRLSPEWEEIFTNANYDFCINAAGSGNVSYSMTHPVQDFEANTLDPLRILDMIRRHNAACKYVHISSAAVYGNPASLPVAEEFVPAPLSAYGWHKLMSEMICREFQNLYGVKTAVVRPFSVYGAGLKKQLLWDISSRLRDSDSIKLFGTGNESRDFIHVSDLVILIDAIMNSSPFCGDIYNAASGEETTIRTIADLFQQHYGGKKEISFSGEVRPGDPLNWRASITKSQTLGFKPQVKLEEGVQQYINWFRQIG